MVRSAAAHPSGDPRVVRRLAELDAVIAASTAEATARAAHDRHRHRTDREGLVLNAGTNAALAPAAAAHDLQLGMRPSMGHPGVKAQPGLEDVELLERLATTAVGATVGADHVDVRPASGTLANLAVYTGLLEVGSTIAALPAWAGGHVSHHAEGVAGVRGLSAVELPFDPVAQDIDLGRLARTLERHRPALVVVGGSLPLFPYRLRELADQVHASGGLVLYDASHTAGLVAGGAHQRPLAEGADVVTFSTYKSFGGPAGGVVACSDPVLARRLDEAIYPALTANYDAGRLLPLAHAARWLVDEGRAYAEACVACARLLAEECAGRGLAPLARGRGFTASHVLALRQESEMAARGAVAALAEAWIYASVVHACDEEGPCWAVRLGTQEAVRRGLAPADVPGVAELVERVLVRYEPPESVRPAVRRLRLSWDADPPATAVGGHRA